MFEHLYLNLYETVSVILFGIGMLLLLLDQNLIKKILGLNIIDTGIYLFLDSMGYIEGRAAPIVVDGVTAMEAYINPIPAGLVLTGIVVSVSFSALMLGLCVRLYKRYGTLNMEEIYIYMQERRD